MEWKDIQILSHIRKIHMDIIAMDMIQTSGHIMEIMDHLLASIPLIHHITQWVSTLLMDMAIIVMDTILIVQDMV